jgi:hypothetical protein
MKKSIEKLILLYKSISKKHLLKSLPQSVKLEVPYYSQWESKDLVKDILSGKIDAQEDPNWERSGATDKKEYLHWSWSTCGMACVKMILATKSNTNFPIVNLAKLCMQYGGYRINQQAYENDDYKHSVEGLFYQPLVPFLNKEFNLSAKIVKILPLEEIIYEVSKKNFVIVSVDQKIRTASDFSYNKGGHLVLVLGYDLADNSLLIHNPSGLPNESQEYAKISFKDFEKFFNHKGIIVYSV